MSTVETVTFQSGGHRLLGAFFSADGDGPHPTLLLLHGFPGVERNFDLAHDVRRAGWNVLVFHYRGAWGSDGAFSFASSHDDAPAALQFLRTPDIAARYRIDTTRIAVAGHSMGGFISLRTAANDADVCGAASWAGFNFGAYAPYLAENRDETVAAWGSCLQPLRGASGEALVSDVERAGASWDLRALAARFKNRPVLLVGAERDDVAPVSLHHDPLVETFEAAGVPLTHAVLETEHGFTSHRLLLSRLLQDWLCSL